MAVFHCEGIAEFDRRLVWIGLQIELIIDKAETADVRLIRRGLTIDETPVKLLGLRQGYLVRRPTGSVIYSDRYQTICAAR